MALHGLVFGYPGAIQVSQLAVSLVSIGMLYELADGEFGLPAARIAAWTYALSPHARVLHREPVERDPVFGSAPGRAARAALGARRRGGARLGPRRARGPVRAVPRRRHLHAPIFAIALLWGRWRDKAAWAGAAGCMLAAALTVAPYSVYASYKFDGFVVSHRTLGQPERAAQLLAPHSFLTRHLRWGRWRGLPDAVDEALIGLVVAFSFLTLVGGTIGIGARGKGRQGLVRGDRRANRALPRRRHHGPRGPHALSRAAGAPLDGVRRRAARRPEGRLGGAPRETGRMAATIVVTGILLVLMLRFLPASWPAWGSW